MAQSGNGIDAGMIYQLLTEMSARMDMMSARMDMMSARMDTMSARMDQLLAVVNDHTRILADHGRRLDDLQAGMVEMRQEVAQYHAAVTSQGIHYSELEGRTLRIERHLKLEPGE